MRRLPGCRRSRFRSVPLAIGWSLLLAPLLCSCDQFNPFVPPGPFEIKAAPTGCGVKISSTKTISWTVTFNVSGIDPTTTVQWTFSDGTSGTGSTLVKTFKTAAAEASGANPSEEHDPVNFDVSATANGETVTKRFELPMRGTPDGGPEPGGDVCIVDEGRSHVSTGTLVCYNANPPASGGHYSAAGVAPVAGGFYDQTLPEEVFIHNLEHGCIVLLYDCGGACSDDLKTQLQDLFVAVPPSVRFNEKKMVIARYDGISASCPGTATFPASGPFLAISWGVQHSFATLDTAGILDFYARHVDQGPEDVQIPQ